MKYKENIFSWCDNVVKEVRFFPDRKAIHKELLSHCIDRRSGLQKAGYSLDEAEERVLLAMGSAAETGKALNRVHRPWLGWLWMLSRVLVIILIVTVIWQGWHNRWWSTIENQMDLTPELTDYQSEGGPFGAFDEEGWTRVYWTDPQQQIQRGAYTIDLPYMALWRACLADGTPVYYLDFVMAARDWRFWNDGPVFRHFEMAGSNGHFYKDATYEAGEADDTHGYFTYGRENLFRHVGEFSVYLGDVPGEWMDITWPYGEEFTIRLTWEGVELE